MSLECVACLCVTGVVSYFVIGAFVALLPWFYDVAYNVVFGRRRDVTKFGEWVVITGGTDGIGKELAFRLAGRGLNILLLSRSEERLKVTKSEIMSLDGFCAKVEYLTVDFAKPLDVNYVEIGKALEDKDVGILVNNVGMSYPSAQYLTELSSDFIDQLIDVNLRSTIHMTQLVIPAMKKKGLGAIVCVGSGASQLPSEPLYAVYAGVKGAVETFCRSLQVELQPSGIFVQCHVPLLITTKMSKIRTASLTVPTAKQYAEDAIDTIESVCSCHVTVAPYNIHRIALFVINNIMPQFLWNRVRFSMTQKIRSKYLERKKQN